MGSSKEWRRPRTGPGHSDGLGTVEPTCLLSIPGTPVWTCLIIRWQETIDRGSRNLRPPGDGCRAELLLFLQPADLVGIDPGLAALVDAANLGCGDPLHLPPRRRLVSNSAKTPSMSPDGEKGEPTVSELAAVYGVRPTLIRLEDRLAGQSGRREMDSLLQPPAAPCRSGRAPPAVVCWNSIETDQQGQAVAQISRKPVHGSRSRWVRHRSRVRQTVFRLA